jgi:hypothetical protein
MYIRRAGGGRLSAPFARGKSIMVVMAGCTLAPVPIFRKNLFRKNRATETALL